MLSFLQTPRLSAASWSNYDANKKIFKNIEADLGLAASFLEMVNASYQILFNSKVRIPSIPLPETTPDLDSFRGQSEGFQFVWFGHSTLLTKLDDTVILIDPVFSNNAGPSKLLTKRFQPPVLAL